MVSASRGADVDRVASGVVLELRDANITIGSLALLADVNLTVRRAQCILVTGGNGTGKSTLLRCIAGVKPLSAGLRFGPRRLAYVPAQWSTVGVTGHQWLASIPRRAHRRDVHELLDVLGFRGDLGDDWRNLSFGNRRKLALAEAFSSDSALVVVDELFAGLDRAGRRGVERLVEDWLQEARSVVVAEQEGSELSWEAECLRIADGRVTTAPVEAADTASTSMQATIRGPVAAIERYLEAAGQFGISIECD